MPRTEREPAAVNLLLNGAEAPRTRPAEAEAAIYRALSGDPANYDLRLAGYRFHFYLHQYERAIPHAEEMLRIVARRLNIAGDWRDVRPSDMDFSAREFEPGRYLQCLVALGYCALRIGRDGPAREILAKSVALDPSDRFGGGGLLAALDRRLAEADGEE